MSKFQKVLFVVALGVLLAAGLAFAEGRSQPVQTQAVVGAYKASEVSALYRAASGSADNASTIHADSLAVEKVFTGGYTTLGVSGRMSVASATCVVYCVRYAADGITPKSMSTATLTADATVTDGTAYMAPTVFFDTEGSVCRVFRKATSSGTTALWTEVN